LPLRLSAAAYPGFLRKPGRCSPCSPYLTVSPGSTSALCCLRTAVAGPFPFSARASSRRCPSFNCCDRAAPRSQAQPSPLPPPPRAAPLWPSPQPPEPGVPPALPRWIASARLPSPAAVPHPRRCAGSAPLLRTCLGPRVRCPATRSAPPLLPSSGCRARAWPGYCGPPLAMPPVPAYTAGPAAAPRPFFHRCRAAPAGIDRRPVLPLLRALSSWEEAR